MSPHYQSEPTLHNPTRYAPLHIGSVWNPCWSTALQTKLYIPLMPTMSETWVKRMISTKITEHFCHFFKIRTTSANCENSVNKFLRDTAAHPFFSNCKYPIKLLLRMSKIPAGIFVPCYSFMGYFYTTTGNLLITLSISFLFQKMSQSSRPHTSLVSLVPFSH